VVPHVVAAYLGHGPMAASPRFRTLCRAAANDALGLNPTIQLSATRISLMKYPGVGGVIA